MLGSVYRRVCQKCCKNCSISGRQEVRHFRQVRDKRVDTGKAEKQTNIKQGDKTHSLEHLQVVPEFPGRVPFSRLIKPFGFACMFTGVSFGGAAIWQYEAMRSHALQKFVNSYGGYFNTPKKGDLRNMLHEWYDKLSGTEKLTLGIIAVNVAVFGCWRIPSMQSTMLRWFTASPAAKAICLPMVLCTFSHHAIWHLAINMYVLWSFTRSIGHTLGKEQFLAMYLSAGVWSSFASYIIKVATARYTVSVGASGAIMAVLGAFCLQYPDARLAIVFLPFFTFSAGLGLKALFALETTGVVFGWTFFDHAAHLGGLLYGGYYMLYGHKYLWDKREPLMKFWHQWRDDGRPKDI